MNDQEIVAAAARSIKAHPSMVIASAVKADAVVLVLRTGGKFIIPRDKIDFSAPEVEAPAEADVPDESIEPSEEVIESESLAADPSGVTVTLDPPKPKRARRKAA